MSCIQCVESQLLVVIMSVLVCQPQGVCVCTCVHMHMHIHTCMYLFLVPSSWVRISLLALSSCLLKPQCLSLREEMLLYPCDIWVVVPEWMCSSVCLLPVLQHSQATGQVAIAAGSLMGTLRRRLVFGSLDSLLVEEDR